MMSQRVFQRIFCLSMVLLAGIPAGLHAQSTFGSIVGTVEDASDAALPGVAVTVKSLSSYVSRIRRKESTRTDEPAPLRSEKATDSPRPALPIAAERRDAGRTRDPLANLRKRDGGRSTFDYRPELADPNKLI